MFSSPGRRVVGVSKHLCGAATDLTIRCLTRTLDPARSAVIGRHEVT